MGLGDTLKNGASLIKMGLVVKNIRKTGKVAISPEDERAMERGLKILGLDASVLRFLPECMAVMDLLEPAQIEMLPHLAADAFIWCAPNASLYIARNGQQVISVIIDGLKRKGNDQELQKWYTEVFQFVDTKVQKNEEKIKEWIKTHSTLVDENLKDNLLNFHDDKPSKPAWRTALDQWYQPVDEENYNTTTIQ